jgi:pyruvate formate lyase activating enzyme
MVHDALEQGAKVLVSTYNEPLITSEWAVAVFKEARAAGLLTAFVSNGNGTPQVLEFLRPWIDLYKVDLKSFDDGHYHELGGRIAPILESIRRIHSLGMWLEIVTLLIPNFNDDAEELHRLTEFIASVSPDIPWHVTAFHTDYKMQGEDERDTNVEDLLRAVEIGRNAGLRYIYAGNLPGMVEEWEDTRCPQCRETLIRRYGYHIADYRLTPEGRCPRCAAQIPGRWAAEFEGQITSSPFVPRRNSANQHSRLFTITSH